MKLKRVIAIICAIAVVGLYGITSPFGVNDAHAASVKNYSQTVSKDYKTQKGKTFLTVKSTVKWTVQDGKKITKISGTTAKPEFKGKNAAAGNITIRSKSLYKHYTNSSKSYGYVQVAWPYASANGAVLRGFATEDGYFYVDVKVNAKGKVVSKKIGQMTPAQYKNYPWGKCW